MDRMTAPRPTQPNPAGAVVLDPAADTIRLFGVTYSLAVFRSLASRLGGGTGVDVYADADGTIHLYHWQPRQP